jgi:biopolymer transport protein ExbD
MRKKKEREELGVNLGIIITPMLDMAFQVLAFFIMTYHPSALEGHFDIKMLPPEKVAAKGKEDTSKDPPTDAPPELTDVLLVSVKAVGKGQSEGNRTEGDPSRIELKRPEDSNPELISDLNNDVSYEEGLKKLSAELKKFLEDPSHTKANIKIAPDPELKQRYTLALYDACKGTREEPLFQNIQFVAPIVAPTKD